MAQPGETARVDIGGTGRPIVGRVVAPDGAAGAIDVTLGFHQIRPKVERPANLLAGLALALARSASPQVRAGSQAAPGSMSLQVEPDGSFRAEDVPAGRYELSIQVHAPVADDQCGFGELIGTAARAFDVPAMPCGRSEEPQDLGTVEPTFDTRLAVGDEAPAFEATTLEGEP